MKKLTVIILSLVLCAAFAFALDTTTSPAEPVEKGRDQGWWIGGQTTLLNQGVKVTYDGGRYDISASLSAPLTGLLELGQKDEETGEPEFDPISTFLWDALRIGGSYSVVNRKVFTLNLGAELGFYNNCYYHEDDPEDSDDNPGWGSTYILTVYPTIGMKFQCGESFSLFIDGHVPGVELGIVGGNFGSADADLGAALVLVLEKIYDCVDIGFQFKL